MDRNFARSLKLVLQNEGGWSDNRADPGGPTNKGITIATYRQFVNSKGTVDDLRHITDAEVATVYREQYWNKVRGDDLPDGVDFATFDFAVNSGPGKAAKYLQAIAGVTQDGDIGPATLAAVKAKLPALVIKDLCDNRLAFLKRLPTWGTFGQGWTARISTVRSQSLAMAVQGAAAPVPPSPAPKPAPVTSPPVGVPVAPVPSFWAVLIAALSGLFRSRPAK